MIEVSDIAEDLATLVRTLPGVTAIYGAAPITARVIREVIGRATGTPVAPNSVIVTDVPDSGAADGGTATGGTATGGTATGGTTVIISIGVTDQEPAPEICRRVHDAIADHLMTAGRTVAGITVKVSSIG